MDCICSGCKRPLALNDNKLCCRSCDDYYHNECLNITHEQFSLLPRDFVSNWKCPSCSNVTRREKPNLNTPVHATQVPQAPSDTSMDFSFNNTIIGDSPETSCNITNTKSFNEFDLSAFTQTLYGKLQEWRHETNNNILSIKDDIKCSLSEIRDELKSLRAEHIGFKANLSVLNSELSCLKDSIQFCSGEHEDLKLRVENLSRKSADIEKSPALVSLQAQIDLLEQQARQCNIELCNVPEKKNEYLPAIINNIGTVLKVNIQPQDIVSVQRVPHAQRDCTRPKNIILKLVSRIKRDDMLGAYRRIKELKSDQLDISGTSNRIYMNEHLTLKNKQLFRKCRELARANNYKHVWIRNSAILVRERDDSAAFVVRSESDLDKLKPPTRSSAQ